MIQKYSAFLQWLFVSKGCLFKRLKQRNLSCNSSYFGDIPTFEINYKHIDDNHKVIFLELDCQQQSGFMLILFNVTFSCK